MTKGFWNSFLKDENGQSLMEIIVGLSIGAVLIGTASFGIAFMLRSTSTNQNLGTASQVTQGLLNNVQTFANSEWQNIYGLSKGSNNKYYLVASGTSYFATAGQEGILSNDITNGLVGRWGLDEDVASVSTLTYDMSGNNNIGTLTNGPTRASSTCRFGNCLNFDGIDDYVSNSVSGLPLGSSARTVIAWFKATSTPKEHNTIFAYGTGAAGKPIYLITLRNTGKAYFESGSGADQIFSAVSKSDGNWHQVVLTYDSTTVRMYVDGTLEGSAITTLETLSSAFQLGNMPWDSIYKYTGQIDDARIYNRALSASEVQQLYNIQAFSRYFYVLNVCRTNDSLADISTSTASSCPGGTADDPLTQEIAASTQWIFGVGTDQVSLSRFVTRWGNFSIRQTDWVGGSGQTGPITSPNNQFSSSTNIISTSTFGSFQIQNLTQQ